MDKYSAKHTRIDREKLVFDSDTSNSPIALDSDPTTIQSRIGDVDHTLKPGYCLQFNAYNPDAYIQTKIPSSERDNYNIIIKCDGLYSMYADSTSEYIAIRQITTPTNTEYCNVSYILFKNRTTGKVDHLFECEEGSGTVLYDAVTGDIATLCSSVGEGVIASLSELRTTNKQKQWIRDIGKNLDTAYINKSVLARFNKQPIVKLPFTVCFEFEIDNAQELNEYFDNGGTGNPLICLFNTANSTTGGFDVNVVPGLSRFVLRMYNPVVTLEDGTTTTNGYCYYYTHYRTFPKYRSLTADNIARRQLLNEGRHKLVVVFDGEINDAGVYSVRKIWLDGEQPVTKSSVDDQDMLYQQTNPHHTLKFSTGTHQASYGNVNYTTMINPITKAEFIPWVKLYDFKIFNYDISLEDVPYSLQDWLGGKDIPQELLLVNTATNIDNSIKQCNLSLKHNIDEQLNYNDNTAKYSYFTDDTINKANVAGTSRFYEDYKGNVSCFPNECYGTWLNNVGYSETQDGIFIPRKVVS